jgi:hypothetical protein
MTRSFLYHSRKDRLPEELGTGVSLHSHTSRSRETMSFIPRYVDKVPYMTGRIRHLEARYRERHGHDFDYSRVWWTPPLEPKAAFDLEARQIAGKLGRPALVSLSDHDNVDAGFALEMFSQANGAPISLEWTVPIGESFLHLGVHNLQPGRARMLEAALREVTRAPSFDAVEDMLDELERDPATLIVLNHPLWDEARIGMAEHLRMLEGFLARHGRHIHALELNGLRCPKENAQVAVLAAEKDLPLVGGGDRHGCEPNAILNLSRARTFAEFAAEIRDGAPTHTVYMPQYDEPIRVRILQVMSDVLRTYDNFESGRRRWSDRIFFLCEDATVKRLSDVWTGNGPDIVGQFVAAMRLMESRHFRAVLKLTLAA